MKAQLIIPTTTKSACGRRIRQTYFTCERPHAERSSWVPVVASWEAVVALRRLGADGYQAEAAAGRSRDLSLLGHRCGRLDVRRAQTTQHTPHAARSLRVTTNNTPSSQERGRHYDRCVIHQFSGSKSTATIASYFWLLITPEADREGVKEEGGEENRSYCCGRSERLSCK